MLSSHFGYWTRKKGEIEILFSTKVVNIENKYYDDGIKRLKIPEKKQLLL